MFEDVLKTPADRAKEPDLSLSEDQRWARKAAGILIVVNILIGSALAFVTHGRPPIVGWIISLVLARSLYRMRAGADTIIIVFACIGGVLGPVLYFMQEPLLVAVIDSVSAWGFIAALLMLLTGRPSRRRRIGAIAAYGCFTVLPSALVVVSVLLAK